MQKLYSKNLSAEDLDGLIKNEQIKYEHLKKENENIKEKNLKIQEKLLSYVECDNFTCDSNNNYNLDKYNIILGSVIDYINKLKIVDTHMKKDIYYLFEEFFYCIKEVILKQNNLWHMLLLVLIIFYFFPCLLFCMVRSQLMKKDMSYFNVPEKNELFRKNLLTLRKINEHNSILRARIFLFNKFKEKNENLIHANFEQLELKYKNLKGKESILESKIENLNNKIKKSTEKKLHYDEKKNYLKNLLEDKIVMLEESYNEIKKKKQLINNLKVKKEESVKKFNLAETGNVTKGVFDEYHDKREYLKKLNEMLEEVKQKYECLNKS
ncbi:conserved Plasmodium protein, unknown function [Plasmodium vinckei brucechwatti]|uniref:Uncharacterized protein n=1 Tax=Plasmodium vinckei brucechwatti TaxID=119398 RepID=A0A6V7S0Q5_PLAVN|nr:conserved Plasmodium protein, unknown function [Plasmodium vinckei brucechwatti]